jgi:starch synthase
LRLPCQQLAPALFGYNEGMKIAFVAAEAFPLIKVGGLADVVGSLPQALQQQGHQVTIFLPWYKKLWAPPVGEVRFHFAGLEERAPLGEMEIPGAQVVLVGLSEFYRDQVYGYPDDLERFLRFNVAVAQLLNGFDLVHLHDWHTGFLALLGRLGQFPAPTVFTIHNLAYQGKGHPPHFFHWTGLEGHHYYGSGLEHNGGINLMKCGLYNAQALTTVSPTYAREILTPQFGEGLDGVLHEQSHKLRGILNGIDTHYWNPASDPLLAHPYSGENLSGKKVCQHSLVTDLGLPSRPTLGVVSRLVEQKGIDLVLQLLPEYLFRANLVVLGSGDPALETAFAQAAQTYRGGLAYVHGYNEELAHRIYAGADALLMPSRFEPCGLSQLIAMRYGTLPIAHAVGGLADTVQHGKTGFLFNGATRQGLAGGIDQWLAHPQPHHLAQQAMKQNYSWTQPAQEYLELYQELIDA